MCDIFRAITLAYPTAVFIIVPINNVMAAVFDAPMSTVDSKNTLSIGLLRGSTGDAVGDFTGVFAAFLISGFPLDDKSLSDVRKVQIAVKFCCGPDFTDFDSTVVRRVTNDKIRFLPVFKVQRNILKKSELVFFNGEVVMSVALVNQVGGNLVLG